MKIGRVSSLQVFKFTQIKGRYPNELIKNQNMLIKNLKNRLETQQSTAPDRSTRWQTSIPLACLSADRRFTAAGELSR